MPQKRNPISSELMLAASPAVTAHIDRAAIDRLTDPANYLGLAPQMVDRAVRLSNAVTP